MAELRIEKLLFQRGEFCLLLDELSIAGGEKVAILGENGSGKSTLLQLLAGLCEPQSGSLHYDQRELGGIPFPERAQLFSLLPQFPAVSFPFNVFEVVLFGRFPHRSGQNYSAEDRRLTEEKLDWLDLAELRERKFSELSGGEKQRVMLARVLNQQAPVVYLDEPNASLDIRHSLDIFARLGSRQETLVATVHDVNLAVQYFERFLLLKRGRLLADVARNQLTPDLLAEAFDVQVATGTAAFTFQR